MKTLKKLQNCLMPKFISLCARKEISQQHETHPSSTPNAPENSFRRKNKIRHPLNEYTLCCKVLFADYLDAHSSFIFIAYFFASTEHR